jgi:hypothetical protein
MRSYELGDTESPSGVASRGSEATVVAPEAKVGVSAGLIVGLFGLIELGVGFGVVIGVGTAIPTWYLVKLHLDHLRHDKPRFQWMIPRYEVDRANFKPNPDGYAFLQAFKVVVYVAVFLLGIVLLVTIAAKF